MIQTWLRVRLSPAVGWRTYFSEHYFWNEANIGPFFLCVLATPIVYSSVKSWYWTRQLRKLSTREIISDRFTWLHRSMLDDEVERVLLSKAGKLNA